MKLSEFVKKTCEDANKVGEVAFHGKNFTVKLLQADLSAVKAENKRLKDVIESGQAANNELSDKVDWLGREKLKLEAERDLYKKAFEIYLTFYEADSVNGVSTIEVIAKQTIEENWGRNESDGE